MVRSSGSVGFLDTWKEKGLLWAFLNPILETPRGQGVSGGKAAPPRALYKVPGEPSLLDGGGAGPGRELWVLPCGCQL